MRDPSLYSADAVWTEKESQAADKLISFLRDNPDAKIEELHDCLKPEDFNVDHIELREVLRKLQSFPHIFEVANAQDRMDDFDLAGNERENPTNAVTQLVFRGWRVPMQAINSYLSTGAMEPSVFEMVAKLLRPRLPSHVELFSVSDFFRLTDRSRSMKEFKEGDVIMYPFRSHHKHWTVFCVTRLADEFALARVLQNNYESRDCEAATKKLKTKLGVADHTDVEWVSSGDTDAALFVKLINKFLGDQTSVNIAASSLTTRLSRTLTQVRDECVRMNIKLSLIHI